MNRVIRNLILIALAITLSNQAVAQKAAYTTNSGMTIGFGLGAAYQQSDIANSRGAGFDFTLGSHIYKKENAFLAVDWKFRFLAGENRAHDHRMNIDTTYNNIKYTFFNYDLELGLTLNRLRERTRIVITGFAGAGITHGRTFTDLYDVNGDLYDYRIINPNQGRSQVYADLLSLSDNDYETPLVGKAAVMPTLGIYLGYQFSRSFSIGIEHKTNFSLTEHNSFTGIDIDNKTATGSKKDRNHYTTLGFRWILGGRSSGSVRRNTYSVISTPSTTINTINTVRPVTNPTPVIPVSLPIVDITIPISNPYSTTSSTIDITSRVQNVRGRQDIKVLLNGNNIGFEYNPVYNNVKASLTLTEGNNILVITGMNNAGSTSDNATIIYNKPARTALPDVRFVNPPAPLTVDQNIFRINVQTVNVKAWQDVIVTVNGNRTTNFSLSSGGVVTTNISLKEGANIVDVSGKNESGVAQDRTTITYIRPVQTGPPVVNVITPVTKPDKPLESPQETRACPVPALRMVAPVQDDLTTDSPSYTFRTEVNNITGKNQISLTINGKRITSFNFSGNEVLCTTSLDTGNNTYVLIARNNCGTQTITSSIFYKAPEVVNIQPKPCPKPGLNFNVLTISQGEVTHELRGNVSDIDSRSGIKVTVNGSPFEGFQFVPNTGELIAGFKFNPGSYNIAVSVKNECGEDSGSATVTIDEEKPCGVRINPGNSSWQFCLITQKGTFNRGNLTNTNFSYSGPASSLFFMPIAGGGDAIVNGKPYNIKPGQYYLFTGNITVTVSTKNPGSMGQWSVCIISDKEPVSGNGNNRPISPCEQNEEENNPNRTVPSRKINQNRIKGNNVN